MEFDLNNYIHLVLIGLVSLFPVINPIGSAFIVNHYFEDLTIQEKRRAVFVVAIYVFIVCVSSLIFGKIILEMFGLTIPIIQLGGGIVIAKIGWDLLMANAGESAKDKADQVDQTIQDHHSIDGKLFYPITFPITAGAGTIAVLFTLSAKAHSSDIEHYMINLSAFIISVVVISALVFFAFIGSSRLTSRMGSASHNIITRLMAFLVFSVGLQIASEGVKTFIETL